MNSFSNQKLSVIKYGDEMASSRDGFIQKNLYYYQDLLKFLAYNIPTESTILEIGCGTGYLLNALNPPKGVGIDLSPKMIELAQEKYPHLHFYQMDAEDIQLDEKFDVIIISDTLGYFEDIQKVFSEIKKVATPDTRIILTYHSFLWQPVLKLAEYLGLKMPQQRLNWLNDQDVANLLRLENYEIIKKGRRFLCPKHVPGFSRVCNNYLAGLPLINTLCITGYTIARIRHEAPFDNQLYSVSVVIPARNERGNIENAVKRMPQMGKSVEIIFVEGHSTDGTLDEIKRVCAAYGDHRNLHYAVQDGQGKGDAVRKGFAMATGDILMILDADLTMPPEELPKFYNAISTGKGEFINGCRLVYPMENEAMRFLNMLGNKFFSTMFSFLLGQRLKDTLCGTKVISRRNYLKLVNNRNFFGEFDPFGDFELIFGAAKLNLQIVELPIRYRSREYGKTNISRFTHGWLLLKMVFFAMHKIKFI
jgi:SAM-dependent methyltransferase